MGLALWVILSQGEEINRLASEDSADVGQVLRKGIVCGKGDKQGSVLSQMCLGSHCDSRIGDAR